MQTDLKTVVQMTCSGGFGGAENVAFSLTKILADRVDRSILYLIVEERTDKESREKLMAVLENYDVKYHLFFTSKRLSYSLLKDLSISLRRDCAQIIHVHDYKSAFFSFLLRHLFKTPFERLVFTLHGLFEPLTLKTFYLFIVNFSNLYFVDKIIGCSEEILSKYYSYPLIKKKSLVIQNCLLSDSNFNKERVVSIKEKMRVQLSERYGLDNSSLWVANIGRLTEQKNFPLYLEVIKEIKNSQKLTGGVQFLIVGSGRLETYLKELAFNFGVDDIVFFTSHISDMDMLFTSIDMVVVTSVWEGTPMSVLEAMAYGKTVVATEVGGIPDIIDSGVNGCLVQSDDLDSLKEAIVDLLKDYDLRQRLGDVARETILNSFSQDKWAEKHMDLYRSILI